MLGLASCCSCCPPPRVLTITAIAQLFVLGCTWASGLFLFQDGSYSHVLAYIFTILNSFQGLFLFLLHCLLNKKVGFGSSHVAGGRYPPPSPTSQGCLSPDLTSWALQVREEYWKWAYMVTGNKYSDFTTSTSSSSHNQTKVRADPGAEVLGQTAALGRTWSSLGSSLSRSSGHQSPACDHRFWPGQQLLWPPQQLLHMLKTIPSSHHPAPSTLLGEGDLIVVLWCQT